MIAATYLALAINFMPISTASLHAAAQLSAQYGYEALNAGKSHLAAEHLAYAMRYHRDPARQYNFALQRGYILSNMGEHDQAADAFGFAASMSDTPAALKALGYAHLANDDAHQAIKAFAKAVAMEPSDTIHAQLGYLYRTIGDQSAAASHFQKAIDLETDEDRILRLRREVRALHRTVSGNAGVFWRTDTPSPARLDVGDRVISQSQGFLNTDIPLSFLSAHRQDAFTASARVFWAVDGISPLPRDETTQAGIGLKWKPLANQNVIIAAERLVSVGAFARDDWLFRLSFSAGKGFEQPKAADKNWLFWSSYSDFALIGLQETDIQIANENRLGLGTQFADIRAKPHLIFSGTIIRDSAGTETLLETGPAFSLDVPLDGTRYRASVSGLTLNFQYRIKLLGSARSKNGPTLQLLLSF